MPTFAPHTIREDLPSGNIDYSISLVCAPGTCGDHILHAMCERLVDESHPDGGIGEELPVDGHRMANDLLAEAEDWLHSHHRCGPACADCPQCHPV